MSGFNAKEGHRVNLDSEYFGGLTGVVGFRECFPMTPTGVNTVRDIFATGTDRYRGTHEQFFR